MMLEKIIVGMLHVNCYVTGAQSEAIVIDPGSNAQQILATLNRLNVNVRYIVLTHCHFDHILAAQEIKDATDAKIVLCQKEVENLADNNINMTGRFTREPHSLKADILVQEGDTIQSGKHTFRVIETPGHTSGGMCLYCAEEKVLFSGDTLFKGSIGRHDFPTGNLSDLLASIRTKLMTLPEDVRVYPGHDAETTIAFEAQNNPYLL